MEEAKVLEGQLGFRWMEWATSSLGHAMAKSSTWQRRRMGLLPMTSELHFLANGIKVWGNLP
jgi:hypothetical protein